MKHRLFAFLIAACLATVARAESYVARDDVRFFIIEMQEKHGFDAALLTMLFARAKPIPSVLKAIQPPADPAVRSWQAYRNRFVEPRRIEAGREFLRRHAAAFARASALYDVPQEIVAAIIGIETIYGRNTGRFGTFGALATLAFDYPPRASLFRRELEALLLLARDEGRDPGDYRGSYAGALGLPQFLPSSIRSYAVDFDGNGTIELGESPADAIGSVARFLKEHGWEAGGPVAARARVTGDPAVLIGEGIRPRRLPGEMAEFGVACGEAPRQPAALIDLATPGAETEYWLGFNNFYVLTRYNRSSFYAMAVLHLAEALANATEARPGEPLPAKDAASTAPAPRPVSAAPARGSAPTRRPGSRG